MAAWLLLLIPLNKLLAPVRTTAGAVTDVTYLDDDADIVIADVVADVADVVIVVVFGDVAAFC